MTDENKKKILFVVTKSNWGGAQKYIYDLAVNIPPEYKPIVIHGGNGLMCEKLDEAKIKRIEIKALDRDVIIWNDIKVLKNLIDIFKLENPSIIHLNSSKIGGLGALAGRIAGTKKIIFTAHGFAFNEDRPLWQRFLIKTITYITLLLSHQTIVISKKEFDQIKDWPLLKNKISLIYNGSPKIDFIEKTEARKFFVDKLKIENKNYEDLIWVGTISELTKNKGLGYAIKGIRDLKKSLHSQWNGMFVIVGSGEERGYLENLIEEYSLEEDVYLAGFIDAKKYLKAFDIFLLSSVKEGLPYVLLEAGLAGNIIISTDVGGTSEIIDNLDNGFLIRSKNPKEIMNAIRVYMENEEKMSVFGNKIQKKIEKDFSVEKMVSETTELYKL
jgi:glycosyltransferase involved in cell wall biosynthesis